MELWRRNLLLTSGLLEALIFTGCLFGWPSLLLILQEEGVYKHICYINSSTSTSTLEELPIFISPSGFEAGLTTPLSPAEKVASKLRYYASTPPPLSSEEFEPRYRTPPRLISESQEYYEHSASAETTTERVTKGPRKGRDHDCEGGMCGMNPSENLKHEKPSKPVKCAEQQVDLTLIYTFAAVMYGITAVLIGMSLEFLGLRVSRVIGTTITCAGFGFLAYTTPERWYYLWPALNLLAVGSNLLRFAGFQFADLWPEYRATILTTYSAGYAVSTSFFILLQLMYEWNVSMRLLFIICGSLCALTYIPTVFIPSPKKITNSKPKGSKELGDDEGSKVVVAINPDEIEYESFVETRIQMKSLRNNEETLSEISYPKSDKVVRDIPSAVKLDAVLQSITSVSGMLHTYWHFINLFLILFYSSTFNMWAGKVAKDPEDIAFYIKLSGVCSFIGPIFAPATGFVTDLIIKAAATRSNELERIGYAMQAPTFAMFVATFLLTLTMACKLFMNQYAIYTSFALIGIARPAVVGSCMSYIRLRFPEEQFNILNGFFTTFKSIVCFVQYPLMKWLVVSEEEYMHVHILLLVMLILSFASPVHMMFRRVMMKYARERWMDNLRSSYR